MDNYLVRIVISSLLFVVLCFYLQFPICTHRTRCPASSRFGCAADLCKSNRIDCVSAWAGGGAANQWRASGVSGAPVALVARRVCRSIAGQSHGPCAAQLCPLSSSLDRAAGAVRGRDRTRARPNSSTAEHCSTVSCWTVEQIAVTTSALLRSAPPLCSEPAGWGIPSLGRRRLPPPLSLTLRNVYSR